MISSEKDIYHFDICRLISNSVMKTICTIKSVRSKETNTVSYYSFDKYMWQTQMIPYVYELVIRLNHMRESRKEKKNLGSGGKEERKKI